MKITTFILLACFMQVTAKVTAQISISERNVPISSVLARIQQQSGYNLFYEDTKIKDVKINVNFNNIPLIEALERVLKNQALAYELVDKTIVIKTKEPSLLDKAGVILNSVQDLFQRIDVSGVVLDEKGNPLPGATVNIKGFRIVVITDKDGHFYLPGVDDKATLVISYVGFIEKEVPVKSELTITLQEKSDELQEVVVAYGKTTQKANTGAITVVKGEQIENLPNRSFDKSLQGLVPGLLITSGSGLPGSGVSNFVLRGISTVGSNGGVSTVRNPLIVIDGIPVTQDVAQLYINALAVTNAVSNPLAQLNSSDIESISVLKDASAISLYGSKASNGVILITTKKGKAGQTRFNLRHQTDISTALQGKNNFLNQQEYLDLLYETYRNTPKIENGVEVPWTDQDILADLKSKFPTRSDGSFYPQADWNAALYDNNASTHVNELSISGGNDKSLFYMNLEYTKQNGVQKKTGYDRKSLRLNFEHNPLRSLKLGLNTTMSYNVQDYGSSIQGGDLISGVGLFSPLLPIRLEDGSYNTDFRNGALIPNQPNPVQELEYNTNRNTAFRALNKLYLEFSPIRDLKFTSNLGIDFMLSEAKEISDPRIRNQVTFNNDGRIQELDTRMSNLISTNMLAYVKQFGEKHTMDLTGGMETQVLFNKELGAGVTRLGSYYYDQLNSPGAVVFGMPVGMEKKETLLSYFASGKYGFLGRYFATASFRTDGSSKFGANKRFAPFWSTGLAWVVSEESFLKNSPWLEYMKLRGSIGAAGNSGAIDRFTPYDVISTGRYRGQLAVLPGTGISGNPNVQWERTFSYDLGLEMRFLKGRVNLTADWYKKNTSNLIYNLPLPGNSGFGFMMTNIGDMENKGLELSLSSDIVRTKSFTWNINGNWSTNKNILVKAADTLVSGGIGSVVVGNKVGENFNSFYMVRWAGVDPQDGSPLWYDINGIPSKVYDNRLNSVFVGKPQPDGFGSITNTFSYRQFQASIQFYYQYGNQVYADVSGININDGASPYINQSREALSYWKQQGDISTNPKRILNNPVNSAYYSTRYMIDGDHIRLQNVYFSYNLDGNAIKRLKMQNIKIFVQGNNLALWTKYKDRDISNVDVNGSLTAIYPAARSYSIGLNVQF